MKYNRSEIPAYILWVEERPTMNGKGKEVYYNAVRHAARQQILQPITSNDIEIEISYVTNQKKSERKDTDNVNKPTLDALEGFAYENDNQVRSVQSVLFDKNESYTINGRVEHIQRLFRSNKPHILLINIFSDTRLAELGGAEAVELQRISEIERKFAMRPAIVKSARPA